MGTRGMGRQWLTDVKGEVTNGVFTECLFGLQVVTEITSITVLIHTPEGYRVN